MTLTLKLCCGCILQLLQKVGWKRSSLPNQKLHACRLGQPFHQPFRMSFKFTGKTSHCHIEDPEPIKPRYDTKNLQKMIEFLYISFGETYVIWHFLQGTFVSWRPHPITALEASHSPFWHLRSNLYLTSLSTKNTTQCGEKTRLDLKTEKSKESVVGVVKSSRFSSWFVVGWLWWHGFVWNFWIARNIWVTPLKTGLFRSKQGVIRGFELMI